METVQSNRAESEGRLRIHELTGSAANQLGMFFDLRYYAQACSLYSMTAEEAKFFKAAFRNELRMQHRFVAEPVLAKTGKGYLKSEGVDTLQRIKANLKKRKSVRDQQ